MSENILINNVTLDYARLATPYKNQWGGENYELRISTRDAAKAQEMRDHGLNVKEPEAGLFAVNLKRKATKSNGEANAPVRVVDSQRNAMENLGAIGNGSVGNVIVYKYDYDMAGNKGTGFSLTALQITDLVIYEAGQTVDFDVVEETTGESSPF